MYVSFLSYLPAPLKSIPPCAYRFSLFSAHPKPAVVADSTVHLVRSVARSTPAPSAAPAPSPAAAAAAAASPFGAPPPSGGVPGAPGGGAAAGNPFAEMMGMGAGGMDINRMQQQLMSNPEMMANIMNSPMMEVGRSRVGGRGVYIRRGGGGDW